MSEYIKFSCEVVAAGITSFGGLAELNAYRRRLVDLRLIGVDSNGIGFGNLSVRDGATDNFYITGSATAGLHELTLANCAKVVACDFSANRVRYEGSAIPSSESLTHAAIYKSDATARAVIHCHELKLWAALLNQAPTTSNAAEYGTPELAYEITQLFTQSEAPTRKIVVMAGHEGGILTFGKDLEEAFVVLMRESQRIY
ncbi:MAG: class II aldolase/adducin family protein [Verrucomicrobia bacterium]|nr:class II aldolase/adducin family protein [Verrucomicrobiota bacterium]